MLVLSRYHNSVVAVFYYMDNMKIKLTLVDWDYTCADGCCYDWGTDVFINGEEVSTHQSTLEHTLREVLEHLGYEVEIEYGDYNEE